jgi:pyruvate kinase
MSLTKIIATIGPSIEDYSVLKTLALSGMNCIRINTAHASEESIEKIVKMRNSLEIETGRIISIMVDLKGEELRILTKSGDIEIKAGKEYKISDKQFSAWDIAINLEKSIGVIEPGDLLIAMDGRVKFQVNKVENGVLTANALTSGTLKNKGRLNIPGRYVPLASVTERDREFLQLAIKHQIEFCAMSFVQSAGQINDLHDLIMEMNGNLKIIAKIETKKALDNIREIVAVADVIMVARGDLGVEVPLSEVSISQKEIISVAHSNGVPTIVATQILESMVNSETPTRAEVSDITNAILDNADALMLSEETAVGKYPEAAVKTLSGIAEYVERKVKHFPGPDVYFGNRVTFSISKATRVISDEVSSDAIIVITRTGNTARMVSAVRPSMVIIAAVPHRLIAGFTTLLRGVIPVIIGSDLSETITIPQIIEQIRQKGMINTGNRIVVTSGIPEMVFGGTTEVKVMTVGDVVGRGFGSGKSMKGKLTIEPDYAGEIILIKGKIDINKVRGKKGIITERQLKREEAEKLRSSGITTLSGVVLFRELKNSTEISVDIETGVIYL